MYLIKYKSNTSQRMDWGNALPKNMELMDLAALIPGERSKRSEFFLLFLILTMIAVRLIKEEDWFENHSGAYSTILYHRQRYYKPLIIIACQEYETMGRDRTWLIERSKRLYHMTMVSPKSY